MRIIKPIADTKNNQTFLNLSCTEAEAITRASKMAIDRNQTQSSLPGSGEAILNIGAIK